MQPPNIPPSSAPDKRDEQPKPKTLLLEFYGIYEPYGEVAELDTLSDAELRATVADWVKPNNGRPPCSFIVRWENGRVLLVGPLDDGFQVRDAQTGEVLEHVPTRKPARMMKKPPGSRPKVRVGKNLSPLAKGHP